MPLWLALGSLPCAFSSSSLNNREAARLIMLSAAVCARHAWFLHTQNSGQALHRTI